jgi:hypothetical protein
MTPEYILRKSLCRPPFCAEGKSIESRASYIENMGWASEYAEPGYTQPEKGILFSDWNYFCREVCNILERAGYELEWEDEWSTCGECGKAVRTSPDSYCWQPSYFFVNDCEILCVDCTDKEEYLESIEDNPRTALNDHIDPADYGYVKLEGNFESGWHNGQTDDPKKIYARLHAAGHKRLLFNIDKSSQFYIVFSIWEKKTE